MLHNSTERAVTLAGNAEAITKCIYQICSVMIEVGVCFFRSFFAPRASTRCSPPRWLAWKVNCHSVLVISQPSSILQKLINRLSFFHFLIEPFHRCAAPDCCHVQSPPKGATIPYRPKATLPPVLFANGQAYTIQGQYAVHQPDVSANSVSFCQISSNFVKFRQPLPTIAKCRQN